MLNLQLRDEFLGSQSPGTVIVLSRGDNTGAIQQKPNYILDMTYPTADVQIALKALRQDRSNRPIVLIGERGRGKSHIMAAMHHAVASPEAVEVWAHQWATRPGTEMLRDLSLLRGFYPISEAVHNHEYPFLWDLLFDRHPRGDYYKGKFEASDQYYPPASLLLEMFASQPTVLILDEFQKWFDGLPETDAKGRKPREWASTFIQNLSEMAVDHPENLVLVISVLNGGTDAYQQVHRNGPVLIDFSGPTARRDRQRMVLHRLFKNRIQIPTDEIEQLVHAYAQERFRFRFAHLPDVERGNKNREVVESWPFAPELLELLEDHILMAEAAQDKRDLIRILAELYQVRGEAVPLLTPADFHVDSGDGGVQSLLDSIATGSEQERLREIAQRNLENITTVGAAVPHARDLITSLWMRSMSPGKNNGGTRAELQLDITRQEHLDNNAFQNELNQLIENSINIHGEESADGRLYFGLDENPRTKVRTTARNDKLWQSQATGAAGNPMVYPGKDREHLQSTLNHVLKLEGKEPTSRVIVLGPNWRQTPWGDIGDNDHPRAWDRPILLVIPQSLEFDFAQHRVQGLGQWLATHVNKRRNTVRFLLPESSNCIIYQDPELVFLARCSYLTTQAWKNDRQYSTLKNDFDKPLRDKLKSRFSHFAILRHWNYPQPDLCQFDIERMEAQGADIPFAVDEAVERDLFDLNHFRKMVLAYAQESKTVGDLLDELVEPPPSPDKPAIPYLGDTKIYEKILSIAVRGDIALNVGGKWYARPAGADEVTAEQYMRAAFRAKNEMRSAQLGEPSAVGGGTVGTAPPPMATTDGSITAPTTFTIDMPTEQEPVTGGEFPLPIDTTNKGGTSIDPPRPTWAGTAPALPPLPKRQKSETNSAINLSGQFEKWGVDTQQTLNSARIEFNGLTAGQIKQILQRIPAQYRATLEIDYIEQNEGQA